MWSQQSWLHRTWRQGYTAAYANIRKGLDIDLPNEIYTVCFQMWKQWIRFVGFKFSF